MFNNFFQKSCHLRDNMEKYGTDGQNTDNDVIWRRRFVCWINKATDMHSEYVIVIGFFTASVVRRKRKSVTRKLHVFTLFF
jgi:hypothetical protein